MNVKDSEIDEIYLALVGSAEGLEEKIREGEERLDKVAKQLSVLAQRKEKLEADIREWKLSRDAESHKTFQRKMASFGIDTADEKTMKKILNLLVTNLGQNVPDSDEKAKSTSNDSAVADDREAGTSWGVGA